MPASLQVIRGDSCRRRWGASARRIARSWSVSVIRSRPLHHRPVARGRRRHPRHPYHGIRAITRAGGELAQSLIPLIEKGLPFQSVYVDLHSSSSTRTGSWRSARKASAGARSRRRDHHARDGHQRYLEDVFPGAPLGCGGAARVRCLEQVLRRTGDELYLDARLAPHGRHHRARSRGGEFERQMEHIPLRTSAPSSAARSGFSEADSPTAPRRSSTRWTRWRNWLAQSAWIAGDDYARGRHFIPCCASVGACFRRWRSPSAARAWWHGARR